MGLTYGSFESALFFTIIIVFLNSFSLVEYTTVKKKVGVVVVMEMNKPMETVRHLQRQN